MIDPKQQVRLTASGWVGDMSLTRAGTAAGMVNRAILFASLPVVKMRKQSTAFSTAGLPSCTQTHTQHTRHHDDKKIR